MKTNLPSTDPSPLYGKVFEKWLRDKIFAVACKELDLDEADRDLYVGTEYYVMRTIDDVGKELLKQAVLAIESGTGEHSAFASLLDFKDMVNRGSYFPKPAASEKPAPPRTTPVARPALVPAVKTGETLGDQLGTEGVDALNASIQTEPEAAVTPEPAASDEPEAKPAKGKRRAVA